MILPEEGKKSVRVLVFIGWSILEKTISKNSIEKESSEKFFLAKNI
jgi:hypothetical protein